MNLKTTASLVPHTLQFKFDAGTSRGVLREHHVQYLILNLGGIKGVGEIAPLPKLSIDYQEDFQEIINQIDWSFCDNIKTQEEVFEAVSGLKLESYPSLVFAIETALLDIIHGGEKQLFACPLFSDNEGIPINGLVWLNTKEHMLGQVKDKLEQGYRCIKMKIGAINLEEEVEILRFLRESFSSRELVLRVDANGAFDYNKAKDVLRQLEELDIHSIEQPIEKGQECFMRTLSKYNRVGVALDEELIGVSDYSSKKKLIEEIQPNYLILKPTLLGGFKSCLEWIEIAKENEIDWWLTSALESNIGLNAVSQFASYLEVENYQGLGTGQLYHNNLASPLEIVNGFITYNQSKKWEEIS